MGGKDAIIADRDIDLIGLLILLLNQLLDLVVKNVVLVQDFIFMRMYMTIYSLN